MSTPSGQSSQEQEQKNEQEEQQDFPFVTDYDHGAEVRSRAQEEQVPPPTAEQGMYSALVRAPKFLPKSS